MTRRWEYDEFGLDYDGDWSETLNQHGLQGWELVTIVHDESSDPDKGGGSVRFVFKRELVDDGERAKSIKTHRGTENEPARSQVTRRRARKQQEDLDESEDA